MNTIIETTAVNPTPTARLIAARGKVLDRAAIARLPDPLPMGPLHKPVPHRILVETIDATLQSRGFRIAQEQFTAMREHGTFLFGTMVLEGATNGLVVPGAGLALGFRSGNAQEKPIEFVAGNHVFVCYNLVLRGDFIVMKKKHTNGLNLAAEIGQGVDRFLVESGRLVHNVDQWQNVELTDGQAREFFFKAAIDSKVFPVTRLPDVWANWADPKNVETPRPECEPRNLWAATNAVTRAVRDNNLTTKFQVSTALTNFANKYVGIN